ncbi:MAG TPA: methylated-DNA--[protein]-cysteine S-methyltransferase [Casimicrobiaceae bacterium]|nr:methylated-DNA--[protein]-cysteine S-methyltransferase [Casimicrobiaceae bacterium]
MHEEPSFDATVLAPFAMLGIRTDKGCVTGIEYLPRSHREMAAANRVAERAVRELERYLEDPEFAFTLPLDARGSAFRRRVWDAISAIPVGQSRTYGELARVVHSAPRAVGGACGANPIALVIPCHRVVGSRGVLGGFMNASSGDPLAIKRWLLAHEGYRFGLT